MVSKIAVMALVGILAVPILLGYALNLTQTTETDYKESGDSINATPLLINSTEYTFSHADPYKLNTSFHRAASNKTLPDYEVVSTTKTPLRISQSVFPNDAAFRFSQLGEYAQIDAIYTASSQNEQFKVSSPSNVTIFTVNNFTTLYFDKASMKLYYSYYASAGHNNLTFTSYDITDIDCFLTFIKVSGTFDVIFARATTTGTTFADLAAGFTFNFGYNGPLYSGETYENLMIDFPDYSRNAVITIDLDSITDSSYSFGIGQQCYLEKTTVDGVAHWQVKPRPRIIDNIVPVTDLYYDPSSSNNTYQIKIWIENEGTPSSIPGYYNYIQHYEFRYVGPWPTIIGETEYYLSYDIEAQFVATSPNFKTVMIGGFSDHSPVMRIDDAEFRAMEYNVINNNTYNPASFKENPSTTISNPLLYGSSIEFGGNTYTVSDGNITLGSHQIPVKGLTFTSTLNSEGDYENKIGNTLISATAQPSTIKFNGSWSVNVSTQSMEQYSYTTTEWNAGSFGWDGVDQNFLIVGLLTCLGVFVALGIYARKSRSGGIIPLMIVTGCAAMVFFIML